MHNDGTAQGYNIFYLMNPADTCNLGAKCSGRMIHVYIKRVWDSQRHWLEAGFEPVNCSGQLCTTVAPTRHRSGDL
ncbi:hypothetical protein PoB_004463200 [Plakobranchus ocellatus]|uniref:Uncharacterized protein n=1 Tax=Plakobranchus ocellatus TaxID=259542 RepID=A0AAV4BFB9_9GAST|nr:hypothetical protein PoB_004463200 [Plakobranchus ocellatus]